MPKTAAVWKLPLYFISTGGDKLAGVEFRNQYETEGTPPPEDTPGTPSTPGTPAVPATAVLGDSAAPVIEIPETQIGVLGEAQGPVRQI